MSLLNLTPHPIRVYHPDTPDQISDLTDGLWFRLDPVETPCRLATTDEGRIATEADDYNSGYLVDIHAVRFGVVDNLPDPERGTTYVVPLLVARDQAHRQDLVFPTREVRNGEGTIVGCRGLGRVLCDDDSDGIDLTLGWSNRDTGPVGMRLYALDNGEHPRWAKPHARVAEVPLMENGAREGDRYRLVRVGDRFATSRQSS